MQNKLSLSNSQIKFLEVLSSAVKQKDILIVSLSNDEWQEIFDISRAHNVLPLIFEKASTVDNVLELTNYSQLVMETMTIVAGQIQRTKAFLDLYQKVLESGIHPIVMKGIICRQLYGKFCNHRPSGDEDILIRKDEFYQVQKIFKENGYFSEYKNVTIEQLEELQEITFFNVEMGLSIEVHVNPIGHENLFRRQLNDCFKYVFEYSRVAVINNVPISTMGHTDHMLFLILHAFKHLTAGGFGIRQVLDILLYTEKYEDKFDWEYLYQMLSKVKANLFLADLFYIGNQYLGFNIETKLKPNCPNELLKEILDCGVFGNSTQVQRTAVNMTSAAIRNGENANQSKIKTLLYAIFPKKASIINFHPELQEKPWRLPIYWIKRWGRFLAHNKAHGNKLAAESIKISKRRIELLKKYDIL